MGAGFALLNLALMRNAQTARERTGGKPPSDPNPHDWIIVGVLIGMFLSGLIALAALSWS